MSLRKTVAALLFISCAVLPTASPAADIKPPDPAAVSPLLPARKIHVVISAKQSVDIDAEARSPVQGEMVLLSPGDRVFIEAQVKDGKLVKFQAVAAPVHPERTLTIELSQGPSGTDPATMLQLQNPFPKELHYRAGIRRMQDKALMETDVLPVPPRLTSFENWPEAVLQLALADFQLVDSK